MTHIPNELTDAVRVRAKGLCEYCCLPQSCQEATFHIDHVVPRASDGPTVLENLAQACVTCSLKKAAKLEAVDPETGDTVPLFNPRSDAWDEHFGWTITWQVQGLTPTGRATATALGMNRLAIISIRQMLADAGRFPEDTDNEGPV
jgi:hypothetical protein